MEQSIVLLYGSDTYQIKQKTERLMTDLGVDEYNVTSYDAEEVNIEDALQDASTIPFMADRKLVVVKNATFLTNDTKVQMKHNVEALRRYLDNPVEETVLVIQVPSSKLDKRKAIVKMLLDVAKVEMCEPLKEIDLRSWVKRQLGLEGISIDADALDELLSRVQSNTEVLVNETQKVLLYSLGKTRINKDTVIKVVTRNVEDNVYEIINQILIGDRSNALRVYQDLIYHSEDPLRILGILANKYREILHTKILLEQGADKNDIADYFNASSGRAYYIMKNAKQVKKETVIEQLEKLEELDYRIKSGKIDKKLGLELFILQS